MEREFLADMESNTDEYAEDDIENQRELINYMSFRAEGLKKAIYGLQDYIDGGLTD